MGLNLFLSQHKPRNFLCKKNFEQIFHRFLFISGPIEDYESRIITNNFTSTKTTLETKKQVLASLDSHTPVYSCILASSSSSSSTKQNSVFSYGIL